MPTLSKVELSVEWPFGREIERDRARGAGPPKYLVSAATESRYTQKGRKGKMGLADSKRVAN
jgi:hypothetical protein